MAKLVCLFVALVLFAAVDCAPSKKDSATALNQLESPIGMVASSADVLTDKLQLLDAMLRDYGTRAVKREQWLQSDIDTYHENRRRIAAMYKFMTRILKMQ